MRARVFIDGFNLYHAIDALGEPRLKWLDLWKLSTHLTTAENTKGLTIDGVEYFTAIAHWSRTKAAKHKAYIKALQYRGVTCVQGSFKLGDYKCRASCKQAFKRHEEKKTDINMALAIAIGSIRHEFDVGFVITNDTDLVPAIRVAEENAV